MHAPTDEGELVRAGVSGDPAAADGLWDAYGPGAFAFCHRVLGDRGAAADAAQDAFLLAHAELRTLAHARPTFRVALLRAARSASFELLGSRAGTFESRTRGGLSAAAARLRPQQRAALALVGLEELSYADIGAVLGIAPELVPALLGRARLRLHDELHGTALAAAAVRSPDCEDVLPLLAAAADGELEPADAAWADPHVEHCPACPRTIRAMAAATATYAAWSPAVAPSWLRGATLAEVDAHEPAVASARRPALSTTLVSATLVTAASAALLVGGARSLQSDEVSVGGARLPNALRSMEMAAIATAPVVRTAQRDAPAKHPAAERLLARAPARAPSATAPAPRRAIRPSTPAPPNGPRLEPTPTPTRPTPTAPPATSVDVPEPVSAPAPGDEPTAAPDTTTTTAVAVVASAPASPASDEQAAPQTAPSLPPPAPIVTPPPPVPAAGGDSGRQAPCGRGDGHSG